MTGRDLKALRLRLKLNKVEMAKRLSVHRNVYRSWEASVTIRPIVATGIRCMLFHQGSR